MSRPLLPPVPAQGATTDQLETMGKELARRGLSERAVCACFGVTSVGHAPVRAAAQGPRALPTAAAIVPWLFVAGRSVATQTAQQHLGGLLDQLTALGLTDVGSGQVRARLGILPVGPSLCVSDRHDANDADVVAVPDDSAYHLLGALPSRRVRRWLDVGTGCGIAPLGARGLGATCRGTDLHGRSIELARLGARLSGARDLELGRADLLGDTGAESWDLISFNAPIPDSANAGATDSPYRSSRGRRDLLDEFWHQARRALAADGEVVLHSWIPDSGWTHLELPGRVFVACYTPEDHAVRFGVTSWQPDAPREYRLVHVPLTPRAPHLRRADLTPT